MNTFQVSCFLAVAETLSFARAAEQLHVTHPAVSQQIQSLEKELGVRLFQRTTRTVKLTQAGAAFLDDAKQMIHIANRAKKRFEGTAPDQIQNLSVGCWNYPCLFLLSDTLRAMRSACPDLHPRLQVIPFQHIYRLLEEGDLDAVFGLREPTELRINAQYRELAKSPPVCICAPDNPLASRPQITADDLAEETLVLLIPPKAEQPLVRLQGQLVGDRPSARLLFCESTEAITALVMAGYGVSVMPGYLAPEVAGIVRIPLQGMEAASFGIYYKTLHEAPLLRQFIRCAKENLPV